MTSSNSTPFFSISNADIYRNNQLVFSKLNWAIQSDENWIITGDNASGKTTLVELLVGRQFARRGKVEFHFLEEAVQNGTSIYSLKRKEIFLVSFADHRRLFNPKNYFYQQRFYASDSESITVESYLKKVGFADDNPRHQEIIDDNGLRELLSLSRIKLSSGQMRKLLIATAIMKNPQLLIIDNPYIGLDARSRKVFNRQVDELVDKHGIKIILCGHAEELPQCITHRLHLHNFKSVFQGRIEDYNGVERSALHQISDQGALLKLQQFYQKVNWEEKEYDPIVKLKNVNVKYGDKTILKDLNWTIRKGEKWALIGDNGSGKSTLLGLIYGDHPQAYANEVVVFGQPRRSGKSIWDIKAKTGFVSPEMHSYFPYNFSCFYIVASGLMDAYFLNRKLISEERERIACFFQYFDKTHLLRKSFKNISTGEQRLILFLRALIKNPPLLLLDEPFQGLDQHIIEKAKQLLSEILTPQHTLLFITHYENEIPDCVSHRYFLEMPLG